MLEGKDWPQGSLVEIKEAGLDVAEVGCCAAIEKDGRNFIQRGCPWHTYTTKDEMGRPRRMTCPWRDKNVAQRSVQKDGKVVKVPTGALEDAAPGTARPKNVLYRGVKDTGDKVIRREDFMPCWQFHAQVRDRHGKNGTRIVIRGFDGSTALLPGTLRQPPPSPGMDPIDVPVIHEVPVPAFPKIGESPALRGEMYSARLLQEHDDGMGRVDVEQPEQTQQIAKDVAAVTEGLDAERAAAHAIRGSEGS